MADTKGKEISETRQSEFPRTRNRLQLQLGDFGNPWRRLGTGIFLIGDRAQVDTKIDRPANRLPVQNKRRAPWTGNASVSYEGIFLERAGGQ